MKNSFTLYLAILFILTIISSCDLNVSETPVEIKISNNTGELITIRVFESTPQSLTQEIEIPESESVSKVFMEKESESPIGPKDFFEGDSLTIVFGDNQKILKYKCQYFTNSEDCNVQGNILNISDEKWMVENLDGSVLKQYNFIPEDFENATPCNEECN